MSEKKHRCPKCGSEMHVVLYAASWRYECPNGCYQAKKDGK